MKKTGSRWIAWVAVFVLLGLAVLPDTAYGAGAIDTSKNDCSITFDLSSNYQKKESQTSDDDPYEKVTGYTDFESLEIPVDIYKAADVDVTGRYQEPVANAALYEELKTDLAGVSSRTTAADWMGMAKRAAAATAESSSLQKKEVVLNSGSGNEVTGLTTGLYLVMAQEVQTADYIYTFDPYLVSLPGNDYFDPDEDETGDSWNYDVTVGLKASQEYRYGDLKIAKTLNSYNATLGGATFIFQIEAKKDGKTVYSDVVSIDFNAPGENTKEIKGKIPAGAEVTVTEVYSGASYKVTSDVKQTPKIVADQWAVVTFTNEYDNRLNSGTSIVNHFIAKGDGSLPAQGSGTSGDTTTVPGESGTNTEGGTSQNTDNKQETQNIVWEVEQLYSNGQTGEEQQ